MNNVKIKEARIVEAAAAGLDEFVNVFCEAISGHIGGRIDTETMQMLNADQMTLLVFKTMHDEVMDGGFVQLIYNGYGPFVFLNPFAKAVRGWGLEDLATLVNRGGRLFKKYGNDIRRDCTDEEFMALFEQFPAFDDLDDTFVEHEEEWVGMVAEYIDEHIERFAEVEK